MRYVHRNLLVSWNFHVSWRTANPLHRAPLVLRDLVVSLLDDEAPVLCVDFNLTPFYFVKQDLWESQIVHGFQVRVDCVAPVSEFGLGHSIW